MSNVETDRSALRLYGFCTPSVSPLNPPPSQEMLSSVAEALSIDLETVYVAKNSKPLENDFSARNCAAWYIESAIGGESPANAVNCGNGTWMLWLMLGIGPTASNPMSFRAPSLFPNGSLGPVPGNGSLNLAPGRTVLLLKLGIHCVC